MVNAMWKGGATAVTIQGQRVVSTTGIRCIGNSVQLQGVPYTQPYRISAVGDRATCSRAIATTPTSQVYRRRGRPRHQRRLGRASIEDRVTAPAYDGLTDLQYAKPLPRARPRG